MAQESSPEKLNEGKALPPAAPERGKTAAEDAAPPTAPTAPAAHALKEAPAVVKRSMPMALSICLGLLLTALAGWFFYSLTWFILLLYLSFIAATVLDAPVHWLKNHGLRRSFAAVLLMVGGLIVVAAILYFVGTTVYGQVAAVSTNLERAPQRINDTVNNFKHHFMRHRIPEPKMQPAAIAETVPATNQAATAPASAPGDFDVAAAVNNAMPLDFILSNAMRTVEAISWLVIMFFIVLYMLIDGPSHLKAARTMLPKRMRLEATKLFNEVAAAHRGWAGASLANVASASILTGVGLSFLGVPGAIILGFFAGLGELIPNIGPFVGAMPALLLTLVADPDKFIYVVGMFIVVQTIQSYTISPQMLKFSIELPVLVTIISVLVFGTLFGFLGILVAIPFVADMVVIWNYVAKWREKDSTDYDVMNAPVEGVRVPASPDNISGSRLRKLFRRNRQRELAAERREEEAGRDAGK